MAFRVLVALTLLSSFVFVSGCQSVGFSVVSSDASPQYSAPSVKKTVGNVVSLKIPKGWESVPWFEPGTTLKVFPAGETYPSMIVVIKATETNFSQDTLEDLMVNPMGTTILNDTFGAQMRASVLAGSAVLGFEYSKLSEPRVEMLAGLYAIVTGYERTSYTAEGPITAVFYVVPYLGSMFMFTFSFPSDSVSDTEILKDIRSTIQIGQ